jgi:hypothetical protein
MDNSTIARDYRELFAAMQPALSRLLADTRVGVKGTALSAARITGPVGVTHLDPMFMISTADGGAFRSRRPPV